MQVQKEKKKPPKPPMDFSAPTPEMIEDAKKYGLDLTDPSVFFKKNSISEHGQQTRKQVTTCEILYFPRPSAWQNFKTTRYIEKACDISNLMKTI